MKECFKDKVVLCKTKNLCFCNINFIFFRYFSFFVSCRQRKKSITKERNRRLSKETVECFIKDFATTSCGQNLFKTQLFLVKVTSGLRPEPSFKLCNTPPTFA